MLEQALGIRIIKILVAVAIFLALFSLVGLSDLGNALAKLTLFSAAYLILISILLIYISALKWGYFLAAFGSRVAVFHLFNLYRMGYFVNLIAPSYIAGDAARSWYVGRQAGQHEALAATILERYTGLVAMVSLGCVFVWFVDVVTAPVRLAILAIALVLVVVTMLALSEAPLRLLERRRLLGSNVGHLRKIQAAFRLARSNKTLLAKAFLLSFLFHSVTVLNVQAAAYAVGWYHPPLD